MCQAFTLIELMIVIAIIAIIAAIAIPNLLESRITANESAAAASLKSGIFPAQVQFQSGAYSDIDSNGRGEYAVDHKYLAGGTAVASTGTTPKALSLLAPTFNVNDGTAVGAYSYQCDVCTSTSTVRGDQINAESFFAAYGAPNNPGNDGRRSFGINSFGSVMATKQTLAASNAAIGLAAISWSSGAANFTTAAPAVPPLPPVVSNGAQGTNSIFATNPASTNATVNTLVAAPFLK